MRILLVDNYDSFTYNLRQMLVKCGVEVEIRFPESCNHKNLSLYDKIVLSPGAGLPTERPKLAEIIGFCAEENRALLGVCLGHQAIAEFFGAELAPVGKILHGEVSDVSHNGNSLLFNHIPSSFKAGRYHSWCVVKDSVKSPLIITAWDEGNIVMALEHAEKSIFGIQFHPESIMTPKGLEIIQNWLRL